MNIWNELGIPETDDIAAIKRAYAARLREVHPEQEPEGFQRLREAYEYALSMAECGPAGEYGGSDTPSGPWDTGEDMGYAPIDDEPNNAQGSPTVAKILDALAEGDAIRAQEIFDASIDQFIHAPLELRSALEQELVVGLSELQTVPKAFVEHITVALGWGSQDSGEGVTADEVAYHLGLYLEQTDEERLARLVQDAKAWVGGVEKRDLRCFAASILLGSYRPAYFKWKSFDVDYLDAVDGTLNELASLNPNILDEHIDPKIIRWWTNAITETPSWSTRALRYLFAAPWVTFSRWLVFAALINIVILERLNVSWRIPLFVFVVLSIMIVSNIVLDLYQTAAAKCHRLNADTMSLRCFQAAIVCLMSFGAILIVVPNYSAFVVSAFNIFFLTALSERGDLKPAALFLMSLSIASMFLRASSDEYLFDQLASSELRVHVALLWTQLPVFIGIEIWRHFRQRQVQVVQR